MNEHNREAVIRFRDVSFTYEELPEGTSEASARASGVRMAVDHLDLEIYDGECVAVLGHNGSGKSTFAKLCNGILVPVYAYGPHAEEFAGIHENEEIGQLVRKYIK